MSADKHKLWKDKLYRIQNIYRIRDKNKQLIKIKPNRIQQTIINQFIDRQNNKQPLREFFLKYRQGGVSTICEIWHLDDTIFHKNTITGILADKRENLGYIWEIVRLAHSTMPTELQPRLGDDSKTSLSFPDINSKIFVSLSIKSTALHNLHISEWCFCEDKNINESIAATSPNTNITGETTPEGLGNDGYITYQDGKAGLNGYNSTFFPWWLQDEYRISLNGASPLVRTKDEIKLPIDDEQLMFRRTMMQKLKQDFLKYYPENDETCWLLSGRKFFNQFKVLKLLRESKSVQPIKETDEFIVWQNPKLKHQYVAGADTAEGDGDDYSVLKIIDVTDRQEVFRFRARVGVDYFYRICDEWCRKYNNAWLAVENNNHGHAVILGLHEICRYPNLYEDKKGTRLDFDAIKERKFGWKTDIKTRPLLLDHLKLAIEGDSLDDENNFEPEFSIYDQEFLKECLTFEENEGKFESAGGYHDDCIFATGIAYQLYQKIARKSIVTNDQQFFFGDKRDTKI